jgi:hypothetical protein
MEKGDILEDLARKMADGEEMELHHSQYWLARFFYGRYTVCQADEAAYA